MRRSRSTEPLRGGGWLSGASAAAILSIPVVTTRFHSGGPLLKLTRPTKGSALLVISILAFFLVACGIGQNNNWPGLSASGDVVYAAFGSSVIALDIVEQKQVWTFPAEPQPGQQFYASPSVVEQNVVVGDYGESGGMFSPGVKVSVFGLRQGESSVPSVIWTSAEALIKDRIIAPPLQVGDQVFVGTADNYVYALDAANNGALQWQFETGHSIWGQATYEDGILYVSSLDKSVYALDATTGDLIWESATGGSISDKAKLNSDLVYVASFDSMVHAVDKSSGDVKWTSDATAAIWGAPAFSEGTVFYADLNGNVFAVDGESGDQLWSTSFDNYTVAAPVVKDGVVFVALAGLLEVEKAERKGTLVALDAETGDEMWRETTVASIFTTPVFVGDSIVVAFDSGEKLTIVVFSTQDGSELWTFEPSVE